jgi:hypothetical protein
LYINSAGLQLGAGIINLQGSLGRATASRQLLGLASAVDEYQSRHGRRDYYYRYNFPHYS